MDAQSPVSSKASWTLALPPSCLQFCPSDTAHFVVGTYNLVQDVQDGQSRASGQPQSRDGSLIVFRIDGDELSVPRYRTPIPMTVSQLNQLTSAVLSVRLQTVPQPSALLDLRFHPDLGKHPGILAAVSSTGTLAIFRLDPSPGEFHHLATSSCQDMGSHVLFLQCNWHPVLEYTIATTTSHGDTILLYLNQDWTIKCYTQLDIGNSLEAWSIAFSAPSMTAASDVNQVPVWVYCGGDDSSLRYARYASGAEAPFSLGMARASVTVKGQHDAGVTAILPLPNLAGDGGRLVVTGSYDDHVRLFSIYDPDTSHGVPRQQLICKKDLGGGVWRLGLVDARLRSDGSWRVRILASCMHAGARLVEMTSDINSLHWVCRIAERFEEHKSMNYASDWVMAKDNQSLRCVSSSFYDRLLCLWEYRGQEMEEEGGLEAQQYQARPRCLES